MLTGLEVWIRWQMRSRLWPLSALALVHRAVGLRLHLAAKRLDWWLCQSG
jgi:hypothetical protein